ncbi:TetR/AcrR family transcriptional regulator [Speluncibacter jeojiensis]|uniref:TetR family transcriptional regulator C-terminal domain-containing protein n=1 Tax=Speluncibacter jeojiensis TaxID=2710754 RepID=A0A9X4M3H4_9ACTN|nr:TetR family transcriptional regulator C-terminal domain-containing protein [Corynebacteriales bacterium D3-21]
MPKIVDHEQRRQRLAEAVWTLTLGHGLEGVTLRKVAAEAGVSMGMVQHYYDTRADMVRDAIDRAIRALNGRIESAVAQAAGPDAETILRECLRAVLAGDEEGLRLIRLSVAVAAQAFSDPALAAVLAPVDGELLDFTGEIIDAARRKRGTSGRGGARIDADICWSLATGLGVDVALGHRTVDEAARILDHHLDGLLSA